jgi:predicted RNA-binding Zn-ribbon protein involved in translation (DUF1610 family)
MTHDTPGENHDRLRWCEHCQIAVEPVAGDSGPECPACGGDLS